MAPAPVYPLQFPSAATKYALDTVKSESTWRRSLAFQLMWLSIIVFHLSCGFTYGSIVFVWCEEDNGDVDACNSILYGTMMVLHALVVILMLLRSLWRRSFVFQLPSFLGAHKLRRDHDEPLSILAACRYGLWLLASVHSPYFDPIFVLREFIEIGLQTYQINQLLQLPDEVTIESCRWLAGLLVLNCWSSPFIEFLVPKRRHRLKQLLCLCIDMVFDVVFGVYAPVWITDRWKDNKAPTNQLALAVLSLALFNTLRSIQTFIQHIKDRTDVQLQLETSRNATAALHPDSKRFSRVIAFGNGVLIVWGFVMMVSQLLLDHRLSNSPCFIYWSSWFDHTVYCHTLDVDCVVNPTYQDGLSVDLAMENMHVNFSTLQFLNIRHCPQLVIPQQLPLALQYVDITNCTILTPKHESPSQLALQPINTLSIQACNFSQRDAIPSSLLRLRVQSGVTIVDTNLVSLPETLDRSGWNQIWWFSLAANQFTTVPSVLLRLPLLTRLWLSNNQITSVPTTLMALPKLKLLDLSRNPIDSFEFDNTTIVSPSFAYLNLMDTNLTHWPSGLLDQLIQNFALQIDVNGPLCTELRAADQYRSCEKS